MAIAFVVASALFMENLDSTILVTAIPAMAHSFGVHPVQLSIGVTAYILTLAVLIPVSGWMVDRFGSRRVFGTAIVIFTGASILCGMSQSLTAFTLARILQGIGGAMMVPVGRLVVLRTAKKSDLIRAIATITWPALAAPVLGPPLGGFITTYFSWHWIFYLNVPLGIVALCFALRLMPAEKTHAGRPFDVLGFVLTGVACFAVMYGIDLISHDNTSWPMVGIAMLVGIASGFYAVFHARRAAHPLVDLRALDIPSYRTTIRGGSLFRISIGSIPFLLPLLFQVGFGLDPLTSGMLVLAVFAGNLAMKVFTTQILRYFGFRKVLVVNGLLNAAMFFACMFLTPQTPFVVMAGVLFVSGLTRSMQFTAINTLAFAEVPSDRMSGANTLSNMAQQLALGTGIALGAVSLRVAGLFEPASAGAGIPLASFQFAFAVVGVVALLGVLDVLSLEPTVGDEIRVRKAKSA